MQTFSTRKNALLAERYDSKTGKRRGFWYSWRALAAGLALALLAGSGIAVAAAGAAEAHVGGYDPSCTGVTVTAYWYSDKNPDPTDTAHPQHNSMTITSGSQTVTKEFDYSTREAPTTLTLTFADSTIDNTYTASIDGWDTTSADWDYTWNGTTTGCTTPGIDLSAERCDAVGTAKTDLTADFSSLLSTRDYAITVTSDEAGSAPVSDTISQPDQAVQSRTWQITPGFTYTVTITDTSNPQLTATKSVLAVGCPTSSKISIDPSQCTAIVPNATFVTNANELVVGRSYTIKVFTEGNATAVGTDLFTATAVTEAYTVNATPGLTYYSTVVDNTDVAAAPIESLHYLYLPCPSTPSVPTVTATQCSVTSGTPDGSVLFFGAGLTPGRTYQVTVSDGTTTVYDSGVFTAGSSAWPIPAKSTTTPPAAPATLVQNLAPGTYTVTVVDVLLPTFAATSAPQLLGACPEQPELNITPAQCMVVGDKADIGVAVTDFVANRTYTVSLTQAGATVSGPTDVVAPSTATWNLAPFTGLDPGKVYRVILVDKVVPSVTAAADVALTPCPGNPELTVTPTCFVVGVSTVNVVLSQLVAGQTYTAGIVTSANSAPVNNVPNQQFTTAGAIATVQFTGVPNGSSYTVAVANVGSTLTASSTFTLASCGPELAYTGANPVPPALAGIGFLQMGLIFVGLALVKRRKRVA